ncbi:MAG: hypothetical protein AAF074_07080, partial [Pseudomonadota bacterium]
AARLPIPPRPQILGEPATSETLARWQPPSSRQRHAAACLRERPCFGQTMRGNHAARKKFPRFCPATLKRNPEKLTSPIILKALIWLLVVRNVTMFSHPRSYAADIMIAVLLAIAVIAVGAASAYVVVDLIGGASHVVSAGPVDPTTGPTAGE